MSEKASKNGERLPDPNTLAFGIVQALTGEPPPAAPEEGTRSTIRFFRLPCRSLTRNDFPRFSPIPRRPRPRYNHPTMAANPRDLITLARAYQNRARRLQHGQSQRATEPFA
jgi:hypothetical protein